MSDNLLDNLRETIVTFPSGSTCETATVVWVGEGFVILDRTPFHPVDHTWPDQPGDRGTLRPADAGDAVVVEEAVMAAVEQTSDAAATPDAGAPVAGAPVAGASVPRVTVPAVHVGTDIPVKRGTGGWTWLVAHRIAGPLPEWLKAGADIVATVDAARRAALSRGHTACHLASLALDLAVADLWRKDPGADGLGTADLEGHANQTSSIHEDGARDVYRLGKSLRKAGFDTATFAGSLAEREQAVNARLAEWVVHAGSSRIVTDGPAVTDRRRWTCDLPEGYAEIPCGGTHAASLAEFATITVSLELPDPQQLVMTTTVTPAE